MLYLNVMLGTTSIMCRGVSHHDPIDGISDCRPHHSTSVRIGTTSLTKQEQEHQSLVQQADGVLQSLYSDSLVKVVSIQRSAQCHSTNLVRAVNFTLHTSVVLRDTSRITQFSVL